MDMMSLRRRIMGAEKTLLPSAYQQVEYLESTGTQYIDTGIECTSDLVVDFGFMYFGNDNLAVCGGIDMSKNPIYYRHHCNPTINMRYWMQNNDSSIPSVRVDTTSTYNAVHILHVDPVKGLWECDNESGFFDPMPQNLTTGQSYGIFGRISNTGAIQSKPSRFYWFKFSKNEELIGDLVPCYRKSDSVAGMYDLVSGEFYTNAGSGEFITGSEV